jgi:hypothetical protein
MTGSILCEGSGALRNGVRIRPMGARSTGFEEAARIGFKLSLTVFAKQLLTTF